MKTEEHEDSLGKTNEFLKSFMVSSSGRRNATVREVAHGTMADGFP